VENTQIKLREKGDLFLKKTKENEWWLVMGGSFLVVGKTTGNDLGPRSRGGLLPTKRAGEVGKVQMQEDS
jgi:hypothetical protein